MTEYIKLTKLKYGDKVAVVSPSNGLPGKHPRVQDLGIERLRDNFKLHAKEYPTTRVMHSSLKDRARDVMDAFVDEEIKAVFASVGGSDQIKLIKLLNSDIIKKNPKPFFGFSDNTHLHIFLSGLGIPSYYGGNIMNQFAMQGGMMEPTIKSLKMALFEGGTYKITGVSEYNEIGLSWSVEALLGGKRILEPSEGFVWDGANEATGRLWGGCMESLVAQCTVGSYLPSAEDMNGKILFLESAETIPPSWSIRYLLIGLGERGWFDSLSGVIVGRPKTWSFSQQKSLEERVAYTEEQRETIKATVREYNKKIPIVQNVDFGHTDPQIILPMGNVATLSPSQGVITLNYS